MFSDPVYGRQFFGRQEIIDILVKRADGLKAGYRQNIALIGHRQLGKTSILQHFLHTYNDSQILKIYLEIKPQALDYFVDQFIRSLLYQFLIQTKSINPMETLPNLIDAARGLIPKTVARIEEISALLKRRHAEEAYTKLFELTSSLKNETGKYCIVIFDEFHRLGDFGVRNAFSDFGRRIMVQKETMYLLSSSSFTASRKILAEKLSLLFGHFERIYLEPFGFQTCYEFLEKKLAPLRVSDELKSFIAAFTDGQPFYLNTMAEGLKLEAGFKSETSLSVDTVTNVAFKLLYESQGALNQYFRSKIVLWTQTHSHGSHLLILTHLAKGTNKLKDLSKAINRSSGETSRQLDELMESELIVKTGVFYRLHDKLFRFWLAEVFDRREQSLLDASSKDKDFIESLSQAIYDYFELIKLSPADRVEDLFRNFQNEFVEWGEKKRKLPHFTELMRLEPGISAQDGAARKLIAKGHGRCWICQVAENKVSESEVLNLVSLRQKRRGNERPTHVIVALKGVDENAKLLAKEKKVLTLSLSRVNLLMDLYGKKPIIA